jgi:cytochrome c oxidase subunit I+III
MTRRMQHYDAVSWQPWLVLAAVGALVIMAGIACQVVQLVVSIRDRAQHRDVTGDPWNGRTLEWATASPPPAYNFVSIPVVGGADPLWQQLDALPVAGGLRVDRRELVVTSLATAEPQARETSPRNSIWPFWAAIATTVMLIWSIFSPWAVVWGSIPVAVTLVGWFWPKSVPEDET